MKHWLKRIYNDPCDVCDRLKSIDEGYFVLFNTKRNRYEVHNAFQADTFCFVVPFGQLDSRTVDYCLKTRRQNADKIFAEMERHNASVEKALQDKAKEESKERLERIKKEFNI